MNRTALAAVVGAMLLFGIVLPFGSGRVASAQGSGEILETNVYPEVPLAQLQSEALPDYPVADDHGILLGGVGSDMWRAPADPEGEYWVLTDRGPNGQIEVDGANRRTFPTPEFTPLILHVKASGGSVDILEVLPVVGQSGAPVTGLSNRDGIDETPYDYSAQTRLEFNPSGLDTEGLVRTSAGDFWLVDEYTPSILRVDATGKVVVRYVPAGVELPGADYAVEDTLPAIYAERKTNRGFEGLGLSPDATTLFAGLQSPLGVPDGDTGENSLNTRILAVDIATGAPTAEYVYQFEEATSFDPAPEVIRDAMKLSGVVAIDSDTLLVLERTDAVAKLYVAELAEATNILGGLADDPAAASSLEATENLNTARIVPVAKSLLIDLSTLDGMPMKIEGVAILDGTTVAVANDNDFDIGEFDAEGRHQGDGTPSEILIVRTPPIPGLGESTATPEASPIVEASPVARSVEAVRVVIADDAFSPRSVEVPVGTTVRWVNRDRQAHTVTAQDDSFGSGFLVGGGRYEHTFDVPGTYRYSCDLHAMSGLVRVVEG